MDKSKKVLSITLFLCILTALCAVNVLADSVIGIENSQLKYGIRVGSKSWTFSSLPEVHTSTNTNRTYELLLNLTDTPLPAGYYLIYVSSWFQVEGLSSNYVVSANYDGMNSYGWINSINGLPSGSSVELVSLQSINDPSNFKRFSIQHIFVLHLTSSIQSLHISYGVTTASGWVVGCGFMESEVRYDPNSAPSPEPEPDPEYTDFFPSSYIHNYKTWNDSLPWNSESSYSWTRPAVEVELGTEPEYAVVYNKRSLFLSYVAAGDYSDILTDLTVVSGQIGVRVEKPNWGQSYQTSIDYYSPDHSLCNGYVLLTNGTDPYASGFQSFTVPNTWSSRFVVWQVPLSSYTSQFYFDYYFTLPEDFETIVGFSPSYIMFYFDSVRTWVSAEDGNTYTSLSYPVQNVDYWYWLTGLNIQYQKRSSSSTPSLPPSTVDPEYVDGQNQVDYGLEQEYQKTMEYYQGDSQLTSALSVFNLTNLAGSFQSLYNGLTYSGTDFTFKLPEASVPAIANVTSGFNLWQEQTIPLKEAIDNIPTPVLIIIRFIAWLGVGGAVFLTIKTLLSDLNGGNRDESSG